MTVEFDPLNGELYLILEELALLEPGDGVEAELRALLEEAFPESGIAALPLFAVTETGQTVLEAVFDAIAPALQAGADAFLARQRRER